MPERLARSTRPFSARGALLKRCERCRVAMRYCICTWQPLLYTGSAVCLLMYDTEPIKPSNTGWLIADVIRDTFAFCWSRTSIDERLLALLEQPFWQPYVVFPQEYAQEGQQIVTMLGVGQLEPRRKPLFIVLDGTWHEARKMFRKSPYLHRLPILSLHPQHLSRYQLLHSVKAEHLCTAEVIIQCLRMSNQAEAAQALEDWFTRFNRHYRAARVPPSREQEQLLLGKL